MTIVVVGVVVIGLALTAGAARLGSALVARARADAGADAAALAAADMLALGRGPAAAAAAAHETAAANGAQLVRCECAGLTAEVVVTVPARGLLAAPARGQARAEVDLGLDSGANASVRGRRRRSPGRETARRGRRSGSIHCLRRSGSPRCGPSRGRR
jgi:secretion/DNA translocation related TadE-like protein